MNILMIDTHSRTNAWRLGKKTLHDDEDSGCCRRLIRHFVLHTSVLYEKLLNKHCLDCIPFSKQNLTCCCSLKSICATALPPSSQACSKSYARYLVQPSLRQLTYIVISIHVHLIFSTRQRKVRHISKPQNATINRMCESGS